MQELVYFVVWKQGYSCYSVLNGRADIERWGRNMGVPAVEHLTTDEIFAKAADIRAFDAYMYTQKLRDILKVARNPRHELWLASVMLLESVLGERTAQLLIDKELPAIIAGIAKAEEYGLVVRR